MPNPVRSASRVASRAVKTRGVEKAASGRGDRACVADPPELDLAALQPPGDAARKSSVGREVGQGDNRCQRWLAGTQAHRRDYRTVEPNSRLGCGLGRLLLTLSPGHGVEPARMVKSLEVV